MICKKDHTVDISKNSSALNFGLLILSQVLEEFGVNCIITCGCEGKHSKTSLHYVGHANDIRSRELSKEDQVKVKTEFDYRQNMEGDQNYNDFDLIIEETHFHLEYQLKR